jgi:hypothetical protein
MNKQLHLSKASELSKRVTPVQNADTRNGLLIKPRNGLWTSTWDEERKTSEWVEWCIDADYGALYGQHWFLLTPVPDARICVIDTLADLKGLLKRYRLQCTGNISYLNELHYLDYEHLAQDYDAIHLTEEGQEQTRLSFPENLYGWDSESTVWFRWCFSHVEQIAVPVREEAQ